MLLEIYRRLLDYYGPQGWWPADTPFEVIVGAILTQNTAWRNVEKAIANLKAEGLLDPEKILETPDERLWELIRPAGFYRQKGERLKRMCQKILDFGGVERFLSLPLEELRNVLLSVKGVGPETADAIILYAAEKPVFVVDRYTHRLLTRLGLWTGKYDYAAIQRFFMEHIPKDIELYKEFHALIDVHCKTRCKKKPLCAACPLFDLCEYARDAQRKDG